MVDKLFAEEGKDVLVEDYTMDAAGSLSQMKLAGVEQSILDTYVAEHQKLAEESRRFGSLKQRFGTFRGRTGSGRSE